MQMRALPPDADAGGAPARSGIHGAPRPAPRYVQFTAQPAKRQAENRPARRGIVAFPSRLYDISLIRPAERSVHNGQGKWRIYFFISFTSVGAPVFSARVPFVSPNETLAGREPSLLRPGLGLHRRALHQRRWRPAPHGPHGPQQQRPIIGFPSRLARELRLSSSRYNRHPHHA